TGQRRNSQGQVQNVEATVVNGPTGQRFILLPSGRDTLALQRARAGLLQAENSFRPLSSADRNAARPWVLQTTPYPKGGFAQLARSSPLSEMAEGQLRLINGYYTGGEPALGQPVKVVGTAR
ncbi:MAG TPA: peptidase, partial [Aquabacterium sp.]|nr:peptidase [Aquabacterium sp.]